MTMLANRFSSGNYQVSMLVLNNDKPDTYKLHQRVRCIRANRIAKTHIGKSIDRVRIIRKTLRNNKYDVAISFLYHINVSTLIAAIGINTSIIVSERQSPANRETSILYYAIQNILYKNAKAIVVQTDFVKQLLPKELAHRAVVIPNPVPYGLPERYLGRREKVIVSAGRLSKEKNHTLLIKAFSEVFKKYSDYSLVIYGEGNERERLEKLIQRLGLQQAVKLPGRVNNVDDIIRKSSMFVMTSDYEGISNAMIEALAMGVPTICTDCPAGGARLMINNGYNGILIPVGDEKSLIDSIIRLIEEREFSIKLGINALKIRKEYSMDSIFEKWECII